MPLDDMTNSIAAAAASAANSTVSTIAPWLAITAALAILLAYLRARLRRPRPSYEPKQYLFTRTEWRFMQALRSEFERDFLIFGKVRIADILKVRRGVSRRDWGRAFARISAKHVDYVLVDPGNGRIVCAIELDDPSHERKDRRGRDVFVNGAFAEAKLPLLRVQTSPRYDMDALRVEVNAALGRERASSEPIPQGNAKC